MTELQLPDAASPARDCPICPRLAAFRHEWQAREPSWFNGPVPVFLPRGGVANVRLLIVGLAPGLRGANRTGRPFTGDYAGDLLYSTMKKFGFATGTYEARPDDSLELLEAGIANSVRCVPPENKPTGPEINNCRQFLTPVFTALPKLSCIVTLGRIGHDSAIRALGGRIAQAPFSHGGVNRIAGYSIFSSYHCSRYNTNTGRLTEEMFVSVFAAVRAELDRQP
ncbi:uracil-DNA glycosylase [Aureimonas fodinaquatilis]|uniref:Type-5 uracil-DNA glycosylase n=1 Tax=Aureimonas fodinaquatilis TaxID=2565783 RepID=A0A5B0DZ52_9HYPH|nr:uracil-DNA glycosylase [Aureimonas fodinaquatilis]